MKPPPNVELHGRSLLPILDQEKPAGWDEVYASHTFHEVTMYYPMRVVHSGRFKLIWNIAYPLSYPYASDLWDSATWQDALKHGEEFMYGKRTIERLEHRPEFELYDLQTDPDELHNLVQDPAHRDTFVALRDKIKAFQKRTDDPWLIKWKHE